MPRVAKISDPYNLSRLKREVHRSEYLEYAIARIATALTDQIIRREMPPPTLSLSHKSPEQPNSGD